MTSAFELTGARESARKRAEDFHSRHTSVRPASITSSTRGWGGPPPKGGGEMRRRPGRGRTEQGRRSQVGEGLVEVLVAAAGQADEHEVGVELRRACERMRGLEGGDDPLLLRQPAERVQRLLVARAEVLHAARVAQRSMLLADT